MRVKIKVVPGFYSWVGANTIPGLDKIEIGPKVTVGDRIFDGLFDDKYEIEMEDGKRVYVKGIPLEEDY